MIPICGIAGWYSWSDSRLTQDRITRLWRENEFRGKDAAGVAYLNAARQMMYVKQKGTATELAQALEPTAWQEIIQSPVGLLHTRARTQGTETKNENNHPVLGYGWVVTHNGCIWNDDGLFKHFKVERPADVDSVAINLVLGQGESVEEALAHAGTLGGSATVAAAHISRPDELLLFRIKGSPVHLYWLPALSMLVWSSDSDGIRAVEDIPNAGFAGFSQTYTLPDDTALHLSPAGLKRYALTPRPFQAARSYSGRGAYGGGHSGNFFQGGAAQTTRTTGTRTTSTVGTGSSRRQAVPPGQRAELVSPMQLEDPLFHGSFQEFHYISRYESKIPADGEFVVPTGYGRWALRRTENGITREFRPHRRVRRRWEQEFGDPSEYTIKLPASPEQADDLSDLLKFGQVTLRFVDGVTYATLLCPWCGVLRHRAGWEMRDYVCEWCCIKSIPPRKEESDAPDSSIATHST